MAISEAQVRLAKYPPELIPDSWVGGVALGVEAALLDLRRFTPYLVHLANIQLVANAAVNLRARYDEVRVEENTAAMLSALVNPWWLTAKDILNLSFFGVVGAPVANYTAHYGLWAYPPTIADKVRYGIRLSAKEQAIDEEMGISNTVEKGLLPHPIPELIQREYQVRAEETRSRSVNIAVANTAYTIDTLYPRPGEFLALTRLAAAPGAVAQDVRFVVSRDNDASLRDIPTFPMSLVAGGEIACFIPAMRELRLTTTATVAPGAHLFRYTIQHIRLTNILRVRFGLMPEAEAPADLWKKVLGGVV